MRTQGPGQGQPAARAPVFTALPAHCPTSYWSPLSMEEPRAEQPQHERTQSRDGVGRQQECGVDRAGSAAREERVAEAVGSFGQKAGHCWAVAAIPKTTTAEAAEATRKKHANDI